MSREAKGKLTIIIALLLAMFGASLAGTSLALAQNASASAPYIDVTKVPISITPDAPLPVQATKAALQAPAPVLAPIVAPTSIQAVPATPPFSVSMLLDWLLKLAGIALATLIPLLLHRWLGGRVSAEQLAVYSKLAVDAVGNAEELAHRAVKGGTPTLDSNAKANAAVAYVAQAADALNLRPMAESAVKQLIDAKLGAGRQATPNGTKPA